MTCQRCRSGTAYSIYRVHGGGSEDRLICRIELGDVYGPDIVPAPDCEMRAKHLRRSDIIYGKENLFP